MKNERGIILSYNGQSHAIEQFTSPDVQTFDTTLKKSLHQNTIMHVDHKDTGND